MRIWRAAGGWVAALVLSGAALGVTAAPAGAATQVAPGAVTLVFDYQQPLPALPAPTDGRLAGYGFVAQVTGDLCAATVGDPSAEITASSGDDVCVFSLSLSFAQPDTAAGATPVLYPLVGSVAVDGKSLPISTHALDYAGRQVDFAVAVPPGGSAVLSLVAAGVSQSFSLTSARRIGTAPTAFYRSSSAYELAIEPEVTEHLAEVALDSGATARMDVTLSEVELDYFYPGDPSVRAPRTDEAYLAVTFASTEVPGPSGVSFEGFSPAADGDVLVRLSDGTTIPAQAVVQASPDLLAGTWVFLVPATVGAAQVVVSPGVQDSEAASGGSFHGLAAVRFGNTSWRFDLSGGTTPARASGGLPIAAKAAGGGGGLLVVVGVVVIPLRRRRRAKLGREVEVALPPPVLPPVSGPCPPMEGAGDESAAAGVDSPAEEAAGLGRVRVAVLGNVVVDGDVKAPERPVFLEPLVYLALKAPGVVSAPELCDALGTPDKALKPETLGKYLNRVRAMLRPGSVVRAAKRGWRLACSLECDWASFQALCAFRDPATRTAVLAEALSLVRGVPFADTPDGSYWWADERYAHLMDKAIVAVAHELVQLHEAAGRWEEAAAAATAGLVGSPYSLVLHEDRLRACAGDRPRFEEAWRASTAYMKDDPYLAMVREQLLGEPAH